MIGPLLRMFQTFTLTFTLKNSLLFFPLWLLTAAPAHAVTVSSQNFGQVAVETSTTLSISVPSVTPGPAALSLRYSVDFSMGGCTAIANGCSVPLTFKPTKPGLLQDAVIVKDANGVIVAEIFLYGIGLGPLPVFSPALATLRAQPPVNAFYFGGVAAAPDGKILVVADFQGTIFEFDPSAKTFAAVSNLVAVYGVAVDAAGNLYYSTQDSALHRFDAVTQTDAVFAANVAASNLIIDPAGTLFYDKGDQIFKLDPNTKIVTLVAGNGTHGYGGDGGPAVNAEFSYPAGLALDAAGNLYIGDSANQRVRKVGTSGTITTIAGNGVNATSGDGGLAIDAEISFPSSLVIDAAGDIYVTSAVAGLLRRIDAATGFISTVGGTGGPATNPFSTVGSTGSTQSLSFGEGGMTIDDAGGIWVASNALYEISTAAFPLQFPFAAAGQSQTQSLSLLNAGTAILNELTVSAGGQNASDFSGSSTCGSSVTSGADCTLNVTFLAGSHAISVATIDVADNAPSSPQTLSVSGASGGVFPASQQIAALTAVGASAAPQTVSVQFAGNAAGLTASLAYGSEFRLGQLSCSGSTTASCSVPVTFVPLYPGLRQDAILFLDSNGSVVYECFLSGTGQAAQWLTPGTVGSFKTPGTIALSAIDSAGNLYAVDSAQGSVVYRYTQQSKQWAIVAGQSGVRGNSGDGGLATNATVAPGSVALDPAGNLYIAGYAGIRKVDARTGIISTISLQSGDTIAVSEQGYVFIGNVGGSQVFKLNPSTGAVSLYAGNGQITISGDGGPAISAGLFEVSALAFDPSGNLLISEYSDIRKVDATSGIISTYLSNCGGSVSFDAAGDLYSNWGYLLMVPPGTAVAQQSGTLDLYYSYAEGAALRAPDGTFYFPNGATFSSTSVSPLTLPGAAVNGPSSGQSLSFTNAGNKAITLGTISLTGADAAAFSQTNNCGQSLTPAQTCSVNLTFAPVQQGMATATLTIPSNLPSLETEVEGTGFIPVLALSPQSGLDFGPVAVGRLLGFDVYLLNESSYRLTIAGISISGPNASEFTVTSSCPAVLTGYQDCFINVAVHPSAAGTLTATLNITDDAAGSPQTFALSATGYVIPVLKPVWSSWFEAKPGQQSKLRPNSSMPSDSLFAAIPSMETPITVSLPEIVPAPKKEEVSPATVATTPTPAKKVAAPRRPASRPRRKLALKTVNPPR